MRPSFKAFHFLQHWVYLLRSVDIVVNVNNAVCFGPDTDSAENGIGKLSLLFFFLPVGSLSTSRAASVAILPSGLFCRAVFARCKLGVLVSEGADSHRPSWKALR